MSKGCYTCRRRRIICDNGLPTCRKCRDAGKECLGYQKPLVWVKGGVASRGKMMGRSFNDVMRAPDSRRDDSSSVSSNASPPSAADSPSQLGPDLSIDISLCVPPNVSGIQSVLDSPHPEDYDNQGTLQRAASVPAPWGMVDPLFKDLSQLSRYYIVHFNQNLANYLTLYSDARNPFRDLIPLVADSPLLSHVLAATGALHSAILASGDFSLAPWLSEGSSPAGPSMSSEQVEKAVISSMSRRPTSKAYEHFLGLKQRALQQLSSDIQDLVLRNDNRTLAAIMVLALMDAIESGDGAWKYHLEGAKKLLKGRQELSTFNPAQHIIKWLEDFAVDGFLIIQLMGSTLARPGSLTKPFYTSSMGPAMLKRLEETSWVGCPAYLLEVIFLIHAGLYFDPDVDPNTQPTMIFSSAFLPKNSNPLQSPGALLQHIQAFDPAAWAESMQSCWYLADLSMRTALAAVYKGAVYLYASRVLSRPRPGAATIPNHFGLTSDHAMVADLTIRQIALIPIADPHFKCLIWPTFIAGAECRDPSQRPFLLDKLRALYYDITSVNVRNAAWVLSVMWQKKDQKKAEKSMAHSNEGRRSWDSHSQFSNTNCDQTYDNDDDNDDEDEFDWIQELDESRIDWLFI
ncbi:C6 finger domain protein Acr-2 [Aspergillus sclerotioniger CBS 115572]|uniref:C6 finger domain protein Acr-2 n=1 Tax=Aspergillus sclerotioniger CBS 115572 TaxID=1450535 RepID=A0A317W5J4_9EURO|nr:C6 finger domain protein Acr-2 [Aspergillus sclerotioniger CBS 115572]PWY80318.1 C6 finger domain protein Acr-2 [Aspergillus sclerotioniger CBS 115572]